MILWFKFPSDNEPKPKIWCDSKGYVYNGCWDGEFKYKDNEFIFGSKKNKSYHKVEFITESTSKKMNQKEIDIYSEEYNFVISEARSDDKRLEFDKVYEDYLKKPIYHKNKEIPF